MMFFMKLWCINQFFWFLGVEGGNNEREMIVNVSIEGSSFN